jgi:hypothetical protein
VPCSEWFDLELQLSVSAGGRRASQRGGKQSKKKQAGIHRRPAVTQGESPLDALARLERVWRREEPNRARGGEGALSGFHYQFAVTVREMVRRFRDEPEAAASPAIIAEALEDLVSVEASGDVVITQIKRSAARDKVMSTLDGFLRIDRLARRLNPAIPNPRYQIVVAKGDVVTARGWVREWTHVNARVRKEMAARVRVEHQPDPRLEALGMLANDIGAADPVVVFDRSLAALFNGAGEGATFAGAAQAVWSILLDASRTPPGPREVYVWTERDRQPSGPARGPVLTGRQPDVPDLRAGSFSPRPRLVDAMQRDLLELLADVGTQGRRLTVLFVAGRSGSGKSIILLQLLERLRAELTLPVVLISPSSSSLSEAVAWSMALSQGDPCIIGLDSESGALRLGGWRSLIGGLYADRQGEGGLPVIVTTGSQEEAHALAAAFPDDLTVRSFSMPLETTADFDELARWFARRTGHTPAMEPTVGKPLVWLMFEWYVGDLYEFARRLRTRLLAADPAGGLLAVVRDILVLNQLGVAFPMAAIGERLEPAQRDQLHALLAEESLVIEETPRGGSWLAHPETGGEIYRNWHPARHGEEQTAHVKRATLAVVEQGSASERTRLVVTLHRHRRGSPATALSGVNWACVLASLYPAIVKRERSVPLDQVNVWLSICRHQPLDGPDPVAEALAWLVPQNAGLPGIARTTEALFEACAELADRERTEIVDSVVRMLDARRDIREWPRIARAAMQHDDSERMPRLLTEWLETSDWPAADGWLLGSALERYPHEEALQDIARQVLAAPNVGAWPHTWSGMWALAPSDALAEQALRWLARTDYEHRSWAWVWTALWNAPHHLQRQKIDALALAHDFLESAPRTHGGWVRVFSEAWRYGDQRPKLLCNALGWLGKAGSQSHSGFPYLWQLLWDDEPRSHRELIDVGMDWLQHHPQMPRWGVVYAAVLAEDPSEASIQVGLLWLDLVSPSHYDWGWVFPAVWQRIDETQRDRLLRRGRRWLSEAPDGHFGRPAVITILWSQRAGADLREETEAWLDRVLGSHFGWGIAWEMLGGANSPEAHRRALRFLRSAPSDHEGWGPVWTLTWDEGPTLELHALGREWLRRTAYTHRSRAYVQRRLIMKDVLGDELAREHWLDAIDQALGWMRSVDQWGDGGYIVWERLEVVPDARDELLSLGREWLRRSRYDHPGWPSVWADVVWMDGLTDDLATAARAWATWAPANDSGWGRILSAALIFSDSEQPTQEELAALALYFLRPGVAELSSELTRREQLWHDLVTARASKAGPGAPVSEHVDVVLMRLIARLDGKELAAVLEPLRSSIAKRPAAVLMAPLAAALQRLPPEAGALRQDVISDVERRIDAKLADGGARAAFLRALTPKDTPSLDAAIAREREFQREREDLTAGSAMVAALDQGASLPLSIEVLSWATERVLRSPADRSLEILVTAMPQAYHHVAGTGHESAEATAALKRAREAHLAWTEEHPQVSVPRLEDSAGIAVAAPRPDGLRALFGRWRRLLRRS